MPLSPDLDSTDLKILQSTETTTKATENFNSLRLSANCDPVAREAVALLVDAIQTLNEQLQAIAQSQQRGMLQISKTLSEMLGRVKNILQ